MSGRMDMITFYENGAQRKSDKHSNEKAQDYKDAAKRYQKMLHDAYYEEGNVRGVQALYWLLKSENPDDDGDHPKKYPPRRFVRDWLAEQGPSQINKRKVGVAKSIQSVILSKPNDLIQIDYIYLFRNIDPSVIVADDPDVDEDELATQDKLFKQKKVRYRGAITAVDCFSRYAYVVPIEDAVDSKKATVALKKIIAMAEKQYPENKIKRIQTDKGSEFQEMFRKYLKATDINHTYGFEGRSHSQAIVERFNGTYRRMLLGVLGKQIITPKWVDENKRVVANYNKTPHTTLSSRPADNETKQLVAPRDVSSTRTDQWKQIRNNIVAHAQKSRTAGRIAFKVGEYVRIRIYKPKKNKPNFTYKKGPLWEIQKREGRDYQEYNGIYLITKVRDGRRGAVARAPTYSITARWSKESTPDYYAANDELDGTIPSGAKDLVSEDARTIKIPGHKFNGEVFEKPAYERRFTKEELVRVPVDKKGAPKVKWGNKSDSEIADYLGQDKSGQTIEEYEIEKIVKKRTRKKKEEFLVHWKGYDDDEDTWETYESVKESDAYDDFQKANKKTK